MGVVNGACSVASVSRVFVGLTGSTELGSRELGKVANKWFLCRDPIDQNEGNVVAPD